MTTPTLSFDPWLPDVQNDPYPHYARLRAEAPCAYLPAAGVWAVSRFEDVQIVARDYRRFSAASGVGVREGTGNRISASDPPQHTPVRRMVSPMFRKAVMDHWAHRAEEVAHALIERVAGTGVIDWKKDFAQPLVLTITSEMMGLPQDPELLAKYPEWSQAVMDDLDVRPGDPAVPHVTGLVEEARDFFVDLIEQRKRTPGRTEPVDLIDLLIEQGEPLLGLPETGRVALTLLAAGNQNTADSIAHLLVRLADDQTQWALLRDDPGLAEAALDEVLRHQSPAQGTYRRATHEVELHGTSIPAGGRILMLFGSANRDDEVFEDPDRFEIRRSQTNHFGFGTGVHKCLGEPVARIEGVAAAHALATRIENFDLAAAPVTRNTSVVRGFESVPVVLVPR